LSRVLHGTLAQHSEYLAHLNGLGAGISILVNEGDGRGRKAWNVLRVRAVFVDLDDSSLDCIRSAPLRPHIIVESSPGRYHVYYLIEGLALEDFKAVQLSLAERFNGDKSVCDLSRVMRIPGFHHRKGVPFVSRLLEVNNHDPYSSRDFLEAFQIDLEHERAKTRDSTKRTTGSVIPLHHRNKTLTSLAGTMRKQGMTEKAIEAALIQENQERCETPLEDSEVSTIANSVAGYDPAPTPLNLTDMGNGERLVHYHGQDLRYCSKLGGWMVWDGNRWIHDETGQVYRLAKSSVRAIYLEAGLEKDESRRQLVAKYARASEARVKIDAMVKLAETEYGIPVLTDDFDRDPYLLNCLNGTLDLETGQLREHRREDLITKLTAVPYDPEATCPQFEAFLDRIMAGNQGMIFFLQKALGYSLTGVTYEQVIFFLYGRGANGKTSLINPIKYVMGDYALQTPASTFQEHRNEGPRNDLARLKGARFVCAAEPNSKKGMDEPALKMVSGEDGVTCRFLYKEEFTFTPEFKLFFATNHKPIIRETDHGTWRRVRLIPFDVQIPLEEQDKNLSQRLKAEATGILTWMVNGCLEWQRDGLNPPAEVRDATQEYQEDSDPLADFINDNCQLGSEMSISAQKLYDVYCEYCGKDKPISKNLFGRNLTGRGFERIQSGQRRIRHWSGIELRDDFQPLSPRSDPDQDDSDTYDPPDDCLMEEGIDL
ncbi:MAG: phage/plasmid primase, P4 family, partial [Desulfomonile sp.]